MLLCGWAQTATAGPECKLVSSSATVAIVVCNPAAKQTDWRAAGAQACADKPSCNAWIWDDASKAPTVAPLRDTDMPKSQTGAARAIWVKPGDQLVEIGRARQKDASPKK
jgi:hypothetical protein